MSEGVVERARVLGDGRRRVCNRYFDARGAEFGDSCASDKGIGVDGGDDAAGDAGGDEGIRAGRRTAVVRAGLESDVGGGAADVMTERRGLLQRDDLGVVKAVIEMCAFAEDVVAQCDDAADGGIGRGKGSGFFGEVERTLQMELVYCRDG